MNNVTHILILEDRISDYELAQHEISKSVNPCLFERVENEKTFLQALDQFQPELILCDYKLPDFDGMKALRLAQTRLPNAPVIIWTGSMSEDIAVECMREGAVNYVLKDNIKRLGPAVVQALKDRASIIERTQVEEKYRSIFENSGDGIFQSTPDGRFISVNPAMARIYGYVSPQEMIESVTDIASQTYMDVSDRQKFLDLINTDGIVTNLEMKIRRKDGAIIWSSTTARAVRDDRGNIVYYEGFLRDITEQKRTAEQLAESEKRFRALIENAMDNISLLTRDGTLVWENPSAYRTLGYQPGKFINRNIFELMHPDDLGWTSSLFAQVASQPESQQSGMFRLKHQDDSWRWIEATATNMLDDPSIQAIVINYRDVTQQKNIDNNLRQSEERYRLLFESNPLPMWIFDTETLRFLKVNDAAIIHYGYSRDEFLSMTIKDIRPAEDVARLMSNLESSHVREQPVGREGVWRHVKRDGTLITVEIISHPVEFEGKKGELILAMDITQRYQAETEIQQRNDDLALVNALNDVINQGQGLSAVLSLLRKEIKRIFLGEGLTIYMLSPDGKSLDMQQYMTSPEILKKVEKLIGRSIPAIQIPIQEGGYFHEVLLSKQGRITSDPIVIQKWMEEFTETTFLPNKLRGSIRKLVPSIFKLLNIKSTMLIPLVWQDQTIGLLDISSPIIFSKQDLERIENIAGQLTTAIRRNQMEAELKQERNLLRILIDNIPDRIYAMDREGRKTLSNMADWKASGGKTMEDVIGKTDFDTYPPELAEPFWQLDKQVLESGKPVINFEEPGLDFDGNQVSILTTKIPLRNEEGKVIGLVGVGRDITRRIQAEAKINDLLAFNELILRNSPVGIVTYKVSGEYIFANENAASIVGTDVETLRSQNFHTLETWKRSGLYDMVQQAIKTRTVTSGDFHHQSTFGKDIWITVHCVTFLSNEEEHLLLAFSDITERKKVDAALMESVAQFRTLFEASPEAIVLIDPQGEWTIVDCNSAACKMNGYTREELIGKPIDILNTEQATPESRQEYWEKIKGTEVLRYETIHIHKDGTPIEIEVSTTLIQLGGREMVLGIDRDITERKRAETAEREQRALAEALRDTSQILSGSLEYGEVLDHILASVGRVVPHQAGTIMLIDDGFAHVVRSHGYDVDGFKDEILGIKLSVSETVNLRQILATGQSVIIPDTHEYEGWQRFPITEWLRSSVGAPITIYGEIIGFICLDSDTPHFFTPIHVERLEAFADQAAVAIHNARLLQKAQEEIAVRKQTEQALLQSQSRYHDLFDKSPISLWEEDYSLVKEKVDALLKSGITNLDEYLRDHPEMVVELASLVRIIDVNQTTLQLFHAQQKTDLLKDLSQLLDRDVLMHFREELLGLMSPSRRFVWEGPDTTFDAIPLNLMVTGTLPSGHEDDWSKVLVSIIDITERKRAEQELRASEERFRQLATNIEELFWMTDARTEQEIYTSPAIESIWGMSVEHFQNTPNAFIDSVVPEDRKLVAQNLNKQRSGEKTEMEYRILRPDGSSRWIWDRAFPIFDNTGSVRVVAGIAADVTQRKQAEAALRASEARFSNAFEFAPIGIGLVSLDGQWLKANNSLCMLLGYSEEELKLKTFQEITHPEDLEIDLNLVQQTLTGEITSYQIEKRYFHKTGKVVWVLLSVSLIRDMEERPQYFISQIQDITERKRVEEENRRHVEETDALLRTSLSLTNLDLKTILPSIGDSARELFGADGCRIFLMQADDTTLRCVLALQENSGSLPDLKIRIGEGVTGAVAASGKAEIVNEMQNDPRAIHIPGTDEAEEEAIMFAPLKERDRTIGVISVRRAGIQHPFTAADLELLEALASMAASAVSNARFFEEAQRRLSELEALYENGLAVGKLLEPSEIGSRIISTFTHYLSWHHVAIRLLDSERDELRMIALNQPGLSEEERIEMEHHFNQMVSKRGQGLSGWVVQTGIPLRTGNVHEHKQYVDTQAGIRSGLYMPLKVSDRVIGVISVESELPDAFTEQDERLLATLANQAAIAFENARLYQAAQQEIFERRRAQEALWLSETHYRELADSIADILFELDYDLRYTHWNKASEMFSGIPAEDAIGRSIREVFGDLETTLAREQIYKSVLMERQAKIFETEVLTRGQKRFLEINAYPSARGVSVVAKDVTERKLDEILLLKRFELIDYSANHSFMELIQKTIDEISTLTESRIGFLHIIEDDEKTVTWQAWSSETLAFMGDKANIGMHFPIDSAGVWADAVRQRRTTVHNDYESLPDKKGLPEGHIPLTRELIIPIIRSDKIVAVLGLGNKSTEYRRHDIDIAERFADYAWDVIERRHMEEALANERNQLAQRVEERTADLSRANSNLARALRVKDEFLANMSHELRTPLNAILGLSESLSEQVAGSLNEKQQKYLSTINESGHHLLSLINDILDLAKIEAGQITLDINKVDVNSVCQASLRMIKQLAQRKNQEVHFEIDQGIGLMWADERRLKQMIVNLLSNAVKFTPEYGKLGLEVHGDKAGNKVSITVWDEGIGISESDIQRLFKPFVQLDSGLAREATGTGLGLALVAQMARLHGGSVTVQSQVGQGSRFSVLLPWEPAMAGESNPRLRSTGKFRAIRPGEFRPTILLIEDTHEVVMMLVDYLEMAGFNMVTAQDGVDGLTQAKLSHPSLILMDIQMPRMDGFETTKKLRKDPEFRHTPIIALTALAMPNDRERCLEAGMNEYLSKPVNLKALVKTIKSFLYDVEAKQE